MNRPTPLSTATPPVPNSLSRSSLRRGFGLIALALACLVLSPTVQAVSPPPDGGYPNANTAEGDNALNNLTTGSDNTAIGFVALFSNTTGTGNTANGVNALVTNTTGNNNTANGHDALFFNTTGSANTANGVSALQNNTTGGSNTATGVAALYSNATGGNNTANGYAALFSNSTGTDNTAIGYAALDSNTTGSGNIALGFEAGFNNTTGSNNIDIGNVGVAGEAAKIRIGTAGTQTAAFIAGVRGVAVTGAAVVVSSTGQLGVAPSSERFKAEIKPMDKASEAILALQPVTFRYKHELDPKGIPQFGLVAEQVEKVNPDLVVRDAKGKVFTVRYEAVNAMLLNEFLKEHRKVEKQEATIAQLKSTVAQQKKDFQSRLVEQQKDFQATAGHQQEQIEALTAGLQRVSAQVEMSRPAPQMVLNNQ